MFWTVQFCFFSPNTFSLANKKLKLGLLQPVPTEKHFSLQPPRADKARHEFLARGRRALHPPGPEFSPNIANTQKGRDELFFLYFRLYSLLILFTRKFICEYLERGGGGGENILPLLLGVSRCHEWNTFLKKILRNFQVSKNEGFSRKLVLVLVLFFYFL